MNPINSINIDLVSEKIKYLVCDWSTNIASFQKNPGIIKDYVSSIKREGHFRGKMHIGFIA
jgi:hypothetical protein